MSETDIQIQEIGARWLAEQRKVMATMDDVSKTYFLSIVISSTLALMLENKGPDSTRIYLENLAEKIEAESTTETANLH